MGVETIGTAAGGIASAVGRAAPAMGRIFGEGPSLGGLSPLGKVGPSMESGLGHGLGNIVREGPVGPNFKLENTMPLAINRFNPIGEIRFNHVPSILEQAENVAATTWKATEPAKENVPVAGEAIIHGIFIEAFAPSKPDSAPIVSDLTPAHRMSVPNVDLKLGVLPDVIQVQKTQAALKDVGMVDLSQNVANQLVPDAKEAYQRSQIKPEPIPQPVLVEKTEKKEEVAEDNKTEERNHISQQQEVKSLRLKHVEDSEVSQARLFEIREAIRKAKIEADIDGSSEIKGSGIKELLSQGRRSGILDEDDPQGSIPDGSRVETIDELAVQNYKSEEEAIQKSKALVSEKKPVKRAKHGNSVAKEAVDRVRKYIRFGRSRAGEIAARIIKRKVEISSDRNNVQPVTVRTEEVVERRIEDNPALAQVFKAAA